MPLSKVAFGKILGSDIGLQFEEETDDNDRYQDDHQETGHHWSLWQMELIMGDQIQNRGATAALMDDNDDPVNN